jgi:hypothetical protein
MAELELDDDGGIVLTPGNSPSALRNLESVLVNAPTKELAKLRFSFDLKDGRKVANVIVRAPMKVRERRDDSMVDTIDKMRLERADAPGSESLWLKFSEIGGWQVQDLPQA